MKSFNEYKNGIDTVTESMKMELLNLINEVDFTSFHSIKNTLEKNSKFEKFESIYPPFIDGYFVFENQNVTLKYNHDDKTMKVMDLDDCYNYIEVQADVCLLKYISTSTGTLDMTNEPVITSDILNLEIERLIKDQTTSFSSILVYNSSIGIDNIIKSNIFFILDDKSIIIEGAIQFDEDDNIIINKMDIYNVGKREFRLISKFTTEELNVTAIKYIFENIRIVDMGESLTSVIQEDGFNYFDSEEFDMMIDLKVLL